MNQANDRLVQLIQAIQDPVKLKQIAAQLAEQLDAPPPDALQQLLAQQGPQQIPIPGQGQAPAPVPAQVIPSAPVQGGNGNG